MFVRFRRSASRLQVSLAEGRRIDGQARQEHVAGLGSIECEPMTIAGRVAFWLALRPRLDKLANRIGTDQVKILDAVHARIPMVTIDEQRTLQRENAEADARLWEGLHDMNAGQAEGHKEIAAKSARIAADAEKGAAEAAAKAATAKDRLDRLAKGEDVSGGLRKPMTREDMEKILKNAGWTAADIRFTAELGEASLSEDEFKAFVREGFEATQRPRRTRLEARGRKSRRGQIYPPDAWHMWLPQPPAHAPDCRACTRYCAIPLPRAMAFVRACAAGCRAPVASARTEGGPARVFPLRS
jgi:hypothetical protein